MVLAAPLSAAERGWVADYLDVERPAFFAQADADQRHGFQAARRVGSRDELIRAALLHDIGKRHAELSAVVRALVTAADKLGLPVPSRGRLYLEHGRLAAEELALWGAEPIVVDFARHHHGLRPSSIPDEDWRVLWAADR